jgi:hypothetical protein
LRERIKASEAWSAWWLPIEQPNSKIRPLRILYTKYRSDILDLARKQNLQKTASKAVSEFTAVMTWLESLDEECVSSLTSLHSSTSLIQEQEVSRCFKNVWNKAETLLQQVSSSAKECPTIKKRRHDLSRLGIRAIYERIRRI